MSDATLESLLREVVHGKLSNGRNFFIWKWKKQSPLQLTMTFALG